MKINTNIFLSIYVFLVFLFFTLDLNSSYVFYGNLVLFIPALVLFRFVLYPKISVKKLLFIMFLVVFWETLVFIQNTNTLYDNLIVNTQRSIFLFVAFFLISDIFDKVNIKSILASLNAYIVFLSCIVIFQFLGFYILGLSSSAVDISVLLGGQLSRSYYMDGMYRPTGLMSEPAAFVGAQVALLCLQYLISKKNDIPRIFGILSVLLSMSFAGFIIIGLYCLIVFSKGIKNIIFLGVLGLLAFVGLELVVKERLEILGSDSDNSNNVKIEAINYFISDPMHILFGYGNIVRNQSTPVFFEGATDITFFLASIAIFGVIVGGLVLLIFFYWLFRSNYTSKEKMIVLLPLVKLTNPALIFFSGFIILAIKFSKRERL